MSNLMLPGFGDDPAPLPADLASLHALARDCTRCRLHQGRTQVTWSSGDSHSPLMLLGMGPSVTDDSTGLPYTGPAGEQLDDVLKAAGVSRAQVYLTNAHKCVARAKDDPHNIRPPTQSELKACYHWLEGEAGLVKPKVVLCIGAPTAQWVIAKDFDLTAQHGQIFESRLGLPALATYQPTYITRLQEHDPAKAHALYQELLTDVRLAVTTAGLG